MSGSDDDQEKSSKADRDAVDAEQRLLRTAARRHHADRVAEVAAAGSLAGAAAGALAGPPGALAGAVIGGIAGAIAGEVMDEQDLRVRMHDDALDEEIGVMGGDIGAADSIREHALEKAEKAETAKEKAETEKEKAEMEREKAERAAKNVKK